MADLRAGESVGRLPDGRLVIVKNGRVIRFPTFMEGTVETARDFEESGFMGILGGVGAGRGAAPLAGLLGRIKSLRAPLGKLVRRGGKAAPGAKPKPKPKAKTGKTPTGEVKPPVVIEPLKGRGVAARTAIGAGKFVGGSAAFATILDAFQNRGESLIPTIYRSIFNPAEAPPVAVPGADESDPLRQRFIGGLAQRALKAGAARSQVRVEGAIRDFELQQTQELSDKIERRLQESFQRAGGRPTAPELLKAVKGTRPLLSRQILNPENPEEELQVQTLIELVEGLKKGR